MTAQEQDDERLDRLVERLLAEQMPDGGWNCRRREGVTHASVHTTIRPRIPTGAPALSLAPDGGVHQILRR
jgi:hypothetical protein